MNMSDTFISIKEAIGQIDITFSTNDNAGVIGYIMKKYKLLDLPLYQMDKRLQQIQQASPIVSELFYDYLSEKYPPKPKKKEITRDLLPNIPHPFIQKYTKEPFELSEYFWQTNDFESCIAPILPTPNNNPVFPTTNTPTPANNDELATLQTQLDQAHARIAELERQLNDQPTTNPVTNITPEMQIINAVYGKFWENHKSNEIPPKKETIVSWIKSEYGISDRIAQAIDTIVRPEQYRTGGQKAR